MTGFQPPSLEPRAPSLSSRHHEDEQFPTNCDHCPAELGPGVAYRRVQFVIDGGDSVVGVAREAVEHSFELVLCSACAARIEHWIHHPLGVREEGEVVDELDDQSLLDEIEKEAFILGDGPPIETDVRKWRNVSGVPIFELPERCPLHQESDDPPCYACYELQQARDRQHESEHETLPMMDAFDIPLEVLQSGIPYDCPSESFRGISPNPEPRAPGSSLPCEAKGVAATSPEPRDESTRSSD